jgi:pimeloyl-ACP methyl ester carboxylesterase
MNTASLQSTRDLVDTPPAKRAGRGLLRWGGLLLVLLTALASAGWVYETRSEAAEAGRYPPPGQLVDVGGYRLHINCQGTGSPTVIVDAGLGDWSTAWSLVQPQLARETKTCTYDRAGSGWSDPGPRPRTAAAFSSELHTVLARANVEGPYVLVGHSMGGLTMQLFASQYRSEVVGLVLVDSMHPGEPARPASDVRTPVPAPFGLGTLVRGLGHLGVARVLAGPLGSAPDELSREDAGASVAFGVRPVHLEAFLDEFLGITEGAAWAAEVRTLGDLPVTVLSRATQKSDAKWQAQQAGLLSLSTNSRQLISKASDHAIQLESPAEVVDAVLEVVITVRSQ